LAESNATEGNPDDVENLRVYALTAALCWAVGRRFIELRVEEANEPQDLKPRADRYYYCNLHSVRISKVPR